MVAKEHNISQELIDIANLELKQVKGIFPKDELMRFILLTETIRMYDFLHFGDSSEIKDYSLNHQEIDVIKWGWNLAASILFKSTKEIKGFPLMESTIETRKFAIGILYQLGCVVLLRRTSEMIKVGILSVKKTDSQYSFTMTPEASHQYLDAVEPIYLKDLENTLNENRDHYKGWDLVNHKDIEKASRSYGNFMSKKAEDPFIDVKLNSDVLETKMKPLVKPWDSGRGVMMGYDSTDELDKHFMVTATTLLKDWREESGLHPDLDLGEIKAGDIMAVAICLISFNLKHIKFSKIAIEKYPKISIPQSLTIWCPLEELIVDISNYTGIQSSTVKKVFDVISLKSDDSIFLRSHTSLFMPFIIDLENGFVLRPVASILRNPLNTIKDLLSLRNPNLVPEFTKHREDWLRNYLYAMFMGSRYERVSGNINLRENKKNVTDIDAAIYDRTTGGLAIFQIKWQDYHFNDVKKLRSKASNLTKELDKWTRRVSEWIESNGTSQLVKNLRLKEFEKVDVSKIYLFGLSKDAVRMRGYGFELEEKKIAITTWAQFIRNRTNIGPSKNVFEDLFNELKNQENAEVKVIPKPITFKFSNKKFHYDDLWCVVDG